MARERPRDEVAGPATGPADPFPLKLNGKVIQGFGRGSSELGIPTANIPISGLSVGGHEDVESGVYFGWAGLSTSQATQKNPPGAAPGYTLMKRDIFDSLTAALPSGSSNTSGAVYPMVMSIGWNPYYKNEVRSVEVHIMHDFSVQFYESHMNLIILGFIRPELDYESVEKLVNDIKTDIDVAGRSLARPAYASYANDAYLTDFSGGSDVAS